VLLTVQHDGKRVDAVAQTSKQGYVYVFDRVTACRCSRGGTPVPRQHRARRSHCATQPVPLSPEPFARQRLTEDMLTTRTPEAHAWALQQFRSFPQRWSVRPFGVDSRR